MSCLESSIMLQELSITLQNGASVLQLSRSLNVYSTSHIKLNSSAFEHSLNIFSDKTYKKREVERILREERIAALASEKSKLLNKS